MSHSAPTPIAAPPAPIPDREADVARADATPAPSPTPVPPGTTKFVLSTVLPIVAFSLSLVSLYVSETARRDVARIDVIKTDYALFNALAQLPLDHPATTHLFAVTEQIYDELVRTVRSANPLESEVDVSRLRLAERAVAHSVFVAYEQTFYVSRETSDGDSRRATMAADDLHWFDNLMCNNPRLRWLWDESANGGKLGREFGDELRQHYSEAVTNCPITPDAIGPFIIQLRDAS